MEQDNFERFFSPKDEDDRPEHCQAVPDHEEELKEFLQDLPEREEDLQQAPRHPHLPDLPPASCVGEPRPQARRGMKTFRTGPKGVKADFEEFKLQQKAMKLSDMFNDRRRIAHLMAGKKVYDQAANEENTDSDNDSLDDDEDVLQMFRQEQQQKLSIINEDRPTFGTVKHLNYQNFEVEIDGEDSSVYIVVLLYQDYLPLCMKLVNILENLAPYYPYLKFMKARTDHVYPEFDDAGLPSLLVFRSKQQIDTIVQVSRLLPPNFDDDDFIKFLQHKDLLKHGLEYKLDNVEKPAIKESVLAKDYDSGSDLDL